MQLWDFLKTNTVRYLWMFGLMVYSNSLTKKTGQCFKGIDVKQYFIDTIPHTLEYLNKAIALPSKN